jgi:hypothetical protein
MANFLGIYYPCIHICCVHILVFLDLILKIKNFYNTLPVYLAQRVCFLSSNMSQMHSHGPGQPMHSHGPPGPQQSIQLTPQQIQQLQQLQAQQQQQRMMQQQQPDPTIQAAIDASFLEVKFKLGQPNYSVLLCVDHDRQKCNDCKVDFTTVNELANRISSLAGPIPPPPSMPTNQIAQLVLKAKEEGNVNPYSKFLYSNSRILL